MKNTTETQNALQKMQKARTTYQYLFTEKERVEVDGLLDCLPDGVEKCVAVLYYSRWMLPDTCKLEFSQEVQLALTALVQTEFEEDWAYLARVKENAIARYVKLAELQYLQSTGVNLEAVPLEELSRRIGFLVVNGSCLCQACTYHGGADRRCVLAEESFEGDSCMCQSFAIV